MIVLRTGKRVTWAQLGLWILGTQYWRCICILPSSHSLVAPFSSYSFLLPTLGSCSAVLHLIVGHRGSWVPFTEMAAIMQGGWEGVRFLQGAVCESLYYVYFHYIYNVYILYMYNIYHIYNCVHSWLYWTEECIFLRWTKMLQFFKTDINIYFKKCKHIHFIK